MTSDNHYDRLEDWSKRQIASQSHRPTNMQRTSNAQINLCASDVRSSCAHLRSTCVSYALHVRCMCVSMRRCASACARGNAHFSSNLKFADAQNAHT